MKILNLALITKISGGIDKEQGAEVNALNGIGFSHTMFEPIQGYRLNLDNLVNSYISNKKLHVGDEFSCTVGSDESMLCFRTKLGKKNTEL